MILGMMLMATYAPYSHYQKKALLKQWVKEVTQSIYEARNLAINGLDVWGSNVSVGLYMDTSDIFNTKMMYYGYNDLDPDFRPWDFPTPWLIDEIKAKDLPNSIQFKEIEWGSQFLFFFKAISGDWYYYSNESGSFQPIVNTDPNIDIKISYKWATTSILQSDITYYTKTYIADY